ncbi:uncharacterized protein LOC123682999 [Harmonia axyridis]|uniref:uncharacterized protein LOC123682999 n=1 Tax=Harmonia axyridis TaxID=115357 RepID=UPI001E276757|nr:uncharacterized protein LOC123682999 [Harmonia axyridis]
MSIVNAQSLLCDILKQMMKEKKIEHYKFNIDGDSNNSDGYMGEIVFFHVILDNNERLNLVLKSAKPHETLKKILASDILYNREFLMYTKVFPELENFTKSKNVQDMATFIPKVWFAEKHSDQVNIVLENLKVQNFNICDRKKPMDSSHMRILFDTYGKWHAISMAFRDQHPEKFSSLVENWVDPRLKLIKSLGLVKYHGIDLSVVKNMSIERKRFDVVKVLESIEDQMEDILFRKNSEDEDLLIISHGDNWCTNYMFKYKESEGTSTPNEVFFLDFQFSRLDSPALELSSTLYNMGDKETFKDFDNLLNIYYKSFSKTMKLLGSNPAELFTMDDLKSHWRRHGVYTVLYVFIFLRIALCDADDAPDLIKMAEDGTDFEGSFSFQTKNMEIFWERAYDIFVHYAEFINKLSPK